MASIEEKLKQLQQIQVGHFLQTLDVQKEEDRIIDETIIIEKIIEGPIEFWKNFNSDDEPSCWYWVQNQKDGSCRAVYLAQLPGQKLWIVRPQAESNLIDIATDFGIGEDEREEESNVSGVPVAPDADHFAPPSHLNDPNKEEFIFINLKDVKNSGAVFQCAHISDVTAVEVGCNAMIDKLRREGTSRDEGGAVPELSRDVWGEEIKRIKDEMKSLANIMVSRKREGLEFHGEIELMNMERKKFKNISAQLMRRIFPGFETLSEIFSIETPKSEDSLEKCEERFGKIMSLMEPMSGKTRELKTSFEAINELATALDTNDVATIHAIVKRSLENIKTAEHQSTELNEVAAKQDFCVERLQDSIVHTIDKQKELLQEEQPATIDKLRQQISDLKIEQDVEIRKIKKTDKITTRTKLDEKDEEISREKKKNDRISQELNHYMHEVRKLTQQVRERTSSKLEAEVANRNLLETKLAGKEIECVNLQNLIKLDKTEIKELQEEKDCLAASVLEEQAKIKRLEQVAQTVGERFVGVANMKDDLEEAKNDLKESEKERREILKELADKEEEVLRMQSEREEEKRRAESQEVGFRTIHETKLEDLKNQHQTKVNQLNLSLTQETKAKQKNEQLLEEAQAKVVKLEADLSKEILLHDQTKERKEGQGDDSLTQANKRIQELEDNLVASVKSRSMVDDELATLRKASENRATWMSQANFWERDAGIKEEQKKAMSEELDKLRKENEKVKEEFAKLLSTTDSPFEVQLLRRQLGIERAKVIEYEEARKGENPNKGRENSAVVEELMIMLKEERRRSNELLEKCTSGTPRSEPANKFLNDAQKDRALAERYETYYNHMILLDEQVQQLSDVSITMFMNHGGTERNSESYKHAKEKIVEVQDRLARHEYNLTPDLKTQFDLVQINLKNQYDGLAETEKKLQAEAEKRYIREGRKPPINKDTPPPMYGGGADPIHVYEWEEQMKLFVANLNIDFADCGDYIRKALYGKAKTEFEREVEPNTKICPSLMVAILVKKHGNISSILAHLGRRHEGLGPIADSHEKSQRDIYELAVEHERVTKSIHSLMKRDLNALEKDGSYCRRLFGVLPSQSCLKVSHIVWDESTSQAEKFKALEAELVAIRGNAWRISEIKALENQQEPKKVIKKEQSDTPRPQKRKARFEKDVDHTSFLVNEGDEEKKPSKPVWKPEQYEEPPERRREQQPKVAREEKVNQAQHGASERWQKPSYQDSYQERNSRQISSNQEPIRTRQAISGDRRIPKPNLKEDQSAEQGEGEMREDISNPPDCFLCKLIETIPGLDKPVNRYHKYTASGRIEIDSCPAIILKSVQEKRAFFDRWGICNICFTKKNDQHHDQSTCGFTRSMARSKCESHGCRERKLICLEHFDRNERFRLSRQSQMRRFGLEYNAYICHKETPQEYLCYQAVCKKKKIKPMAPLKLKEAEFLFNNEKEMNEAGRKAGDRFIPIQMGQSQPIYDWMIDAKGENNLVVQHDTGSQATLVHPNFMGSKVKGYPYRDSEGCINAAVVGIGGRTAAVNVVVEIPIKRKNGKDFVRIQALVCKNLPKVRVKPYEDMVLAKNACRINGVPIDGAVALPEVGRQVAMLIGNKDAHLFPAEVFSHSSGVKVYKSQLRSRESKNGIPTFCIGGNLSMANLLAENNGNSYLENRVHSLEATEIAPFQLSSIAHDESEEDSSEESSDESSSDEEEQLTPVQTFCLEKVASMGNPEKPSESCAATLSEVERNELDDGIGKFFTDDWPEDTDSINAIMDACSISGHPGDLQEAFTAQVEETTLKVKPMLADPRCRQV